MSSQMFYNLILFVPPLLFSLSFHEAAHAWMAKRCGDDTAERLGRITLNPIPHIDVFGTIVFPIICLLVNGPLFGWAKPVPVNPRNLKNYRQDDLLISLAGPVSNLILACVFAICLHVVVKFDGSLAAIAAGQSSSLRPVFDMLFLAVLLNLVLAFFNLIPIPPLDGSHVLAGLLPEKYAEMIDRAGHFGFFLLIILLYTGIFKYILVPVNWAMGFLLSGIT